MTMPITTTAPICGSTISALRDEIDLTQEALAKRIGVSAPYISQIETGKRRVVSRRVFYRFCRVLNTPAAALTPTEGLAA